MSKTKAKKIINITFLILTMLLSVGLATEGFSKMTSAKEVDDIAGIQYTQTVPDVVTAVNATAGDEQMTMTAVMTRTPEIETCQEVISNSHSSGSSKMSYIVMIMGACGMCASVLGIMCVAKNV